MDIRYLSYANDNDALVTEKWAREALALLYENAVMVHLVNVDFKDEIAQEGDVVNVHRPSKFKVGRIVDTEDVSAQDAESTNIQVPLDQCLYVTFRIGGNEQSLAFKDLVQLHLAPAIEAMATGVDRMLLGQVYQFIENHAGKLDGMTKDTVATDITAVRKVLENNLVPKSGRSLIFTTNAEELALNNTQFTDANRVGDEGQALSEAMLGRKYGFDCYACQNMPSLAASDVTTSAGALDANEAAGQTVLSVAAAGDETVNHWLTLAGDAIPHMVTAASTGDTITVWPALETAVASGGVVTHYTQCTVNQGTSTVAAGATTGTDGYRAGWHGPIVFDGSGTIAVGQMVTFGVTATTATTAAALARYVVIDKPTTASILLDRPLEVAIADDGIINPGPAGDYNFAFRRDAIAFVSRPLHAIMGQTGALSAVVSHKGLSMRVTITYEGTKRGYLVTIDMLAGVKVLDGDQGAVLYG